MIMISFKLYQTTDIIYLHSNVSVYYTIFFRNEAHPQFNSSGTELHYLVPWFCSFFILFNTSRLFYSLWRLLTLQILERLDYVHITFFFIFSFMIFWRLGRTSEFIIYGHGQQRRAVIEAERLLENDKRGGADDTTKQYDGVIKSSFKDKAKKWKKFIAQVPSTFVGFIRNICFPCSLCTDT